MQLKYSSSILQIYFKYTLYTLICNLYTLRYTPRYTLFTLKYTLYSLRCTLTYTYTLSYTLRFTVYTLLYLQAYIYNYTHNQQDGQNDTRHLGSFPKVVVLKKQMTLTSSLYEISTRNEIQHLQICLIQDSVHKQSGNKSHDLL